MNLDLSKKENQMLEKGKMQAANNAHSPEDLSHEPQFQGMHANQNSASNRLDYESERQKRVLYTDSDIHTAVSLLIYFHKLSIEL